MEGNHSCPKMITLTQFLIGRNLATRILRFNRKTKRTKTVQKLSKNSGSDKGGAARSNNPLNTPLHTTAANHGAEIAGRTKLTNAMLNVAWLVSLVGRTEAVSLSIITFSYFQGCP